MRNISAHTIYEATKALAYKANIYLRPDMVRALRLALSRERSGKARRALQAIIDNAAKARQEKIALCQDTGLPVVFAQIGHEVLCEQPLAEVINAGVMDGYRAAYLRASIQADPLGRTAKPAYAPAVVHVDIVRGRRLKMTLLPKGFGSENKARVMMFNPTVEQKLIEDFVVEAVRAAGAAACPPFIIGIGIGGTQDSAGLLAKKALLRDMRSASPKPDVALLEKRVLERVNKLGIGPMGLGGHTTALAVLAQTAPTHIAGMPVAVNISCHALRSASVTI